MKLATLNQKNPAYAAETWAKYSALYEGGDAFQPHDFLPKNPMEEEGNYHMRCKSAQYTNYVGPIIDWFAASLMAAPLEIKPHKGARAPFYEDWKEDVDGLGTDLVDFARAAFVAACTKGLAWWAVEMPIDEGLPPANRAEWEERDLGRAYLCPIDRSQVFDWQVDERGQLEWAIVHSAARPRQSPDATRGVVVETWRIYDRERISIHEIAYEENKPPLPDAEVPVVAERPHGFDQVPLVCMGFEGMRPTQVRLGHRTLALSASEIRGLWPMARLASIQVAHFRQEAALEWSIGRTCYAMPVFKIASDETPPKMGTGYFIQIARDESVEWIAPPTAHLTIAAQRVDSRREEIYRVANQLAQGVDNNAAAIGRSGESKLADAESTKVILGIFGAVMRDAIEKTYDLVSKGRADKISWHVAGLDKFDTADAGLMTSAAIQAEALQIPSRTFRAALKTRVALALLPGADETMRQKISKEIDDGTMAEETMLVPEVEESDQEPPSRPPPAPGKAPVQAPT